MLNLVFSLQILNVKFICIFFFKYSEVFYVKAISFTSMSVEVVVAVVVVVVIVFVGAAAAAVACCLVVTL
jgi:hypothetical protein